MDGRLRRGFGLRHRRLWFIVALIFLFSMVFSLSPVQVEAAPVTAGDVFSPDMGSGWGTQDNNGWSYMYKQGDAYTELAYHAAGTQTWVADSFEISPVTQMIFIDKVKSFVGESGGMPTYAYKAPSGGQVELSFENHGNSALQIKIYKNDTLVEDVEGSNDYISFNTTGDGSHGDHTLHTVSLDVKKNTMIYIVVTTTDLGQREAYSRNYSVKYLSVNSEEEDLYTGNTFSPDMTTGWGTQDNNGWSYMYKQGDAYTELAYHAASTQTWVADSFEISPVTQMLFIDKVKSFIGESGGKPTYAYKAPIGGHVELSFENHGNSALQIQIYKNDTLVEDVEGSNDYISFNTTGDGSHGDHTLHTVSLDVKKNTTIYIVVSTSDTGQREALFRNYGVKYISTNSEVEPYFGKTFSPDMTTGWGAQDNNGWSYMYKQGDDYNELAYHAAGTQTWIADSFEISPVTQMLFIDKVKSFVGESGGKPTYAYKAPIGGHVELSFENHGNSALQIQIFKNDTLVENVEGSNDFISFNTTGDGSHGDHTLHTVSLDVKKNTMVYIVVSTTDSGQREALFRNYGVKYFSTNSEEEDPYIGKKISPDMGPGWGAQDNNGWSYMYKQGDEFTELAYHAAGTQTWVADSFEISPVTQMLFIDKVKSYIGESGGKPTYAYKAPIGGHVELSFENHGNTALRIQIYKNNELLEDVEGSNDFISFNTAGDGSHGDHTLHTVSLDVKKNTTIYIVVSTTDVGQREAYLRNYGVKYISTNSEVEPYLGKTFSPDMTTGWGAQDNNGWSYMYKQGNDYTELAYHAAGTQTWVADSFEISPVTQMLFIDKAKSFIGESGGRPTYAFKAPIGGHVELSFENHGDSALQIQIFKNDTLVEDVEGSNDYISFNTTGDGSHGDHTLHTVSLDVKKNTMLYIVVSTTDSGQREAYFRNYGVQYVSTNSEVESNDPYIGKTFSPDMTTGWGAQGNNGWSYMYKQSDEFTELAYHAAGTQTWVADSFEISPVTQMLFIDKVKSFIGEFGGKPTYAYKAPIGGHVELSFENHGNSALQIQIFKNDTLVEDVEGSNDYISFNTTGDGSHGDHALHTVSLDVKKNTMIYVVVSTTDPGQREAYFKHYGVKYLSTNSEVETPPAPSLIYQPDPSQWGKQNNNGWYYSFLRPNSALYRDLTYYDSSSETDWQQNRFASDPAVERQMLFITPTSFYVGEDGDRPVYAYKAPVGGQVELSFENHGVSALQARIYRNDALVQDVEGSNDYISFNTKGDGVHGDHTLHTIRLDVKKGTMLYIVPSTTDPEKREGYLKNYRVRYLSTNTAIEPVEDPYCGDIFAPDSTAWGKQNNNGWSYMYKERLGNNYFPLDYRSSAASIDWQKDQFASDPVLMNEMMYISKTSFFVGEKGSMPTYMFEAPVGGRLELSMLTHGTENMHLQLFKNNDPVNIEGKENVTFNTNGETRHTITVDVKKGTKLYLVGTSTNMDSKNGGAREGWVFQPEVRYVSSNSEVEAAGSSLVGKSFTIDIRKGEWGKTTNNNWQFMCYDTDDGQFKWLAYLRPEKRFVGSSDYGYEFCMITPNEVHPSVKALPAKVFVAPSGGTVKIEVMTSLWNASKSTTGTGIKIMLGDEQVYPRGDAEYAKVKGSSTVHTIELKVKKNERVAVMLDSIDGNTSFDSTDMFVCATYKSVNASVAKPDNGDDDFIPASAAEELPDIAPDFDANTSEEEASANTDTVNNVNEAQPVSVTPENKQFSIGAVILVIFAVLAGTAIITIIAIRKKRRIKDSADKI